MSRIGILHRDLKMENVMMKANNRVVLVDFGLSADFWPGKVS